MADPADVNVDDLRRRARRRLVGAIVLALAAAVFVPMLLESDPKPLGEDVSVRIPPVDDGKFVNRLNDASKAPPAKSAAPKNDPRSDTKPEVKAEAARPEPSKAEPPKVEPPKVEAPKARHRSRAPKRKPKTGSTKTEAPKAETVIRHRRVRRRPLRRPSRLRHRSHLHPSRRCSRTRRQRRASPRCRVFPFSWRRFPTPRAPIR